MAQLFYATYYQLVTLVFKNLDSHRGSLRQAEMLLIDYFLSCGLPKVNNRIRAILWIGFDQFLKELVHPFFDIVHS